MKYIKKIIKSLLGAGFWLDFYFLTESKAIKNGLVPLQIDEPTVFFFTTHKCASTFTPKVLSYAAKGLSLKHVDYAKYLWHKTNRDVFEYMNVHAGELFQPTGYVFAPLRQWIDIQAYTNAKVIIMLRDPRDVMVSMYYSMAYTLEMPANKQRRWGIVAERNSIVRMSIDEFVLLKAPHFCFVYKQYFLALAKNKHYYFCTYEQMILNFQDWIAGFGNYLGIDVDAETKQRWLLQITPPQEERLAHKRQMLPGDYKQKLSHETIQQLDNIFSEFLDSFCYAAQ